MGAPLTKQKALCVATRCTTAAQFIETFHRFCDEEAFFVATMNMRPVGLETPFSIQLADKTPVLRGLCVVLAAWPTPANVYKRPGIRLGIRRLTPESEEIFYQLQAMRTATPLDIVNEASEAMSETPVAIPLPPIPPAKIAPPIPKTPTPRAGSVISVPPKPEPEPEEAATQLVPVETQVEVKPAEPPPEVSNPVGPPVQEHRTPGSDLVLPANPLMNLTDESLEGFVDCTLYEETANFFRAPDDDSSHDEVAAPPKPVRTVDAGDPPTFRPSSVIAAAFAEEVTVDKRLATPPVALPVVATPAAPVMVVESTAMPIDEIAVSRVTPLPAGERFSVIPAPRRGMDPRRWLVIGGAAVATILAVVLVFATRSSADESNPNKPIAPTKPVEMPVVQTPKPEAPAVDKVDPEEIAAITDPSKTPVAGDGPCKLEVTTTPAGSMVQVDGQAVGPSPITIAGPCTKRRVDVAHARYKPELRWVTLAPDKSNALDVTLVRPTHDITVTSSPSGATVSIGGRRAGTTPTRLQLMGFSGIDITIEKPGFAPVTKRVYSKVPNDSLAVSLKRAPKK